MARLAPHVPGKAGKLSWRAVLVDHDDAQAFALPDGTVIAYRGLVEALSTEAALAAIVAHDMAHIFARHGTERITNGLVLPGLLDADSLDPAHPQYGSSIRGDLGIGAARGLILPFSRTHEPEADALGMRLMAMGGYDPAALRQAVTILNERYGDTGFVTWLSTHPTSTKRFDAMDEALPTATKAYGKAESQHGSGQRLD